MTIDDDIAELQGNKHFVLSGNTKGKVKIFNTQLKLIETATLNTFKITNISILSEI